MTERGTMRGAFAGLASSRKGLTFLLLLVLIGVASVGLEVAIVVLTIRGRLDVERAITVSLGTLITAAIGGVIAGARLIDAIAHEDAAQKSAPTSIAAGGDVILPQSAPAAAGTSAGKGGADGARP